LAIRRRKNRTTTVASKISGSYQESHALLQKFCHSERG
jgi:hypothetical protein